jgi:hypothetical protein
MSEMLKRAARAMHKLNVDSRPHGLEVEDVCPVEDYVDEARAALSSVSREADSPSPDTPPREAQ